MVPGPWCKAMGVVSLPPDIEGLGACLVSDRPNMKGFAAEQFA